MNCRLCGARVGPDRARCTRCGMPTTASDVALSTPRCEVCWRPLGAHVERCPSCGTSVMERLAVSSVALPAGRRLEEGTASGPPRSSALGVAPVAPAPKPVPPPAAVSGEYYAPGELGDRYRRAELRDVRLPRAGRRGRLAAALLLLVAIAAVAGHLYLGGQVFTPEAMASSYVAAEGRNDGAALWNATTVALPAQRQALRNQPDTRLLSQTALEAMTRLSANRHAKRSDIRVSKVSAASADVVAVQVSFSESGRPTGEGLTMVRSESSSRMLLYPDWRVQLTPGLLALRVPAKAGAIAVDGIRIADPAAVYYAFAGQHRVSMAGSGLLGDQSLEVAVGPRSQAVAALPAALNPSASTAAVKAVQDAMARCSATSSARPEHCPQNGLFTSQPVTWTAVGNQTPAPKSTVRDDGMVEFDSHYQMLFTYSNGPATVHGAVAGPYAATLKWDGQGFSVQGIAESSFTNTQRTRPAAASDSLAVQAAKEAVAACAGITQLRSDDCPQSASGGSQAANVRWQLTNDPAQGAQVEFDSRSGFYLARGSYAMNLSYTESGISQKRQDSGSYRAALLWDDINNKFVSSGRVTT